MYEVRNAGQNHLGYLHQVVFKKNDDKGFNLYLYENQSTNKKGFIAFKMSGTKFNERVERMYLKKIGYEEVNIEGNKDVNIWIIAVALTNLEYDLKKIIDNYYSYIF
jgi:hypothetical protein